MTDSPLRANFDVSIAAPAPAEESERAAYARHAIESISGSMVFVEDKLLYWDILEDV